MKCEYMRELMSSYIDNEINEVDKVKFEKHLAQCPQCKEEYVLLKDVVIECSQINEVELPEDFREELHKKLLGAKTKKNNKVASFIKRNRWKTAAGTAAAVLILAISLNSFDIPKYKSQPQATAPIADNNTGSFGFFDRDVNNTTVVVPSPVAVTEAKTLRASDVAVSFTTGKVEAGGQNPNYYIMAETTAQQARKIIKNGNISLKVADVQSRMQEIRALAEQSGGYEESSYINNIQPDVIVQGDAQLKETTTKFGNMVIKIPAGRFEASFQTIIAMGKLQNQNTNTSDITSQYKDIEARVENLKVQEKHLQEIMTKATTVEDIMKVEAELNRVRTDIDMMTGDLKRWDALVEYSTIYIDMTEVKEAELEKVDVPGVWQKANQGFVNTINNIQNAIEWLLVSIVSALPYIAILGVGLLLAVFWIKRRKK